MLPAQIEVSERLLFEGAAQVRVLQGEVSVYGREIKPIDGWIGVLNDSGRSQMALSISNNQAKPKSVIELKPYKEYTTFD